MRASGYGGAHLLRACGRPPAHPRRARARATRLAARRPASSLLDSEHLDANATASAGNPSRSLALSRSVVCMRHQLVCAGLGRSLVVL